jgi:hypothetical protein
MDWDRYFLRGPEHTPHALLQARRSRIPLPRTSPPRIHQGVRHNLYVHGPKGRPATNHSCISTTSDTCAGKETDLKRRKGALIATATALADPDTRCFCPAQRTSRFGCLT